jgi:outer membrane protein assembly factor BamB
MMFFSHNNRGAWGYIWIQNGNNGATWWALNPLTGDHMMTLTNVPTPNGGGLSAVTQVYQGPSGEMLIYVTRNLGTAQAPNWVMSQWNSTRAILGTTSLSDSSAWGSAVNTAGNPNTYDATRGYDFDIPLTRNMPWYGSGSINAPVAVFPMDRAIFANETRSGISLSAVALDEDNFGQWLYRDRTWTAPKEWEAITLPETNGQSGWACFSDDPYVGVFWVKESRINYVFDLNTGRFKYETKPQIFANSWGGTTSNSAPEKVIVAGKLIECGGGGITYCYNVSTGDLLWTYEQTDKYTESYHREAWWAVPCFVSGDKIYIGYAVHSSQVPLPRGAPFYALDINTGEVVWEIDGAFRQLAWGGRAIIGDSIIATIDSYDSQIYAIGKGPSEVTVASSNAVTTAGNTVLISGTVMDLSPGTEQFEISKRFAKGVPAVADEDMSDWMLYVYKNFERPMFTKGVEITIFAQQGDRVIDIGKIVSDDSGRFATTWTPPTDAAGNWDVYAYFSGSGAYYGSWAKSEMAVLEAPAPPPEPEPLPPYGLYIALAAIAIIIAVVIVGLLLFLRINRKH